MKRRSRSEPWAKGHSLCVCVDGLNEEGLLIMMKITLFTLDSYIHSCTFFKFLHIQSGSLNVNPGLTEMMVVGRA